MCIYFHGKAEKENLEKKVKTLTDKNTRINQQLKYTRDENTRINQQIKYTRDVNTHINQLTELQTEKVKVETELKRVKHKMERHVDQMYVSILRNYEVYGSKMESF